MIRFHLLVFLLLLPMATASAEPAATTTGGSEPAKFEPKNLLGKTNDPDSWVFQMSDQGQGDMKADGDAIVFTTSATDGTDWHVQAYQTGLDLKNGKQYVLKFKCKAPQAEGLSVVGQIHEEDWHEIGLHEAVGSSDDFKQFEFEFTAENTVPGNNRIGFVLGNDKGTVSIKDMTLTEK
jgi:hypothetical protein